MCVASRRMWLCAVDRVWCRCGLLMCARSTVQSLVHAVQALINVNRLGGSASNSSLAEVALAKVESEYTIHLNNPSLAALPFDPEKFEKCVEDAQQWRERVTERYVPHLTRCSVQHAPLTTSCVRAACTFCRYGPEAAAGAVAGDIDQLHQTRASNNGSPLKSKRSSQQSMAPGQAKATLDRAGSLAYVFSVPERLQANVSGFFGGSVALAQVLEEPDHTTAELHAIPSEDDDDDATDSDEANASTGTSPTSGDGGTGSRAASPSSPDAFPTITSLEGATFKPIPPATPLTEGSEERGAVDGVGGGNASPASTPKSPGTPTTGKLRKGRRSKKLSRRSTKHTLKKRRTRGRKPTSGRRLTVARSAKKRSAKRKSSRYGNTRLHAVGCGLDSRWGLCVCVYVCMCGCVRATCSAAQAKAPQHHDRPAIQPVDFVWSWSPPRQLLGCHHRRRRKGRIPPRSC